MKDGDIVKKIKIVSLLIACLCLCSSLTGCGDRNGGIDGLVKLMNVEAKELQSPVYGEKDLASMAVANGTNDFAFRLSAALSKNINDESFVCSPYSVWLSLAALVNATDSQNRDALLAALGASGISAEDVNKAASRMLFELTKERDKAFAQEYDEQYHNPLKIANAIFVGKDVKLRKEFAQTFMDYYRGVAMNVDFGSRDAVDAVNKWASENTDGLITDLIQEFDPSTIAAIANAIYFSDRWQWEFNPDNTTEGVFHSPKGETSAFFMLREGDSQTYYEDETVQAMPLYFKTGGGMYIILPKSGDAVGLLGDMTSEYFDEIQTDSISATGKLLLPRFSINNDVAGLKETLAALGVPLFDEASAPLTGGLIEEDMPIWLSGAIQKAII